MQAAIPRVSLRHDLPILLRVVANGLSTTKLLEIPPEKAKTRLFITRMNAMWMGLIWVIKRPSIEHDVIR